MKGLGPTGLLAVRHRTDKDTKINTKISCEAHGFDRMPVVGLGAKVQNRVLISKEAQRVLFCVEAKVWLLRRRGSVEAAWPLNWSGG